jgi:cobalt-zinc-cadmium efflux system membrane fusion protein
MCALGALLLLAGCGVQAKSDPAAEAPPAAEVEVAGGAGTFRVDHPEQFPLVTATAHVAAPELNVTGTVSPDVSRNVPVISLASGRVTEVHARLGDTVTKGDLLMRVQSADISGAFSDYRQAVADETLSRAQLERAKLLLDKGALAQKDYEIAVDAAEKAKVTVETTREHLRVLGADQDHPSTTIDITAPASGVITDQQVTTASGVNGLSSSTNPFTISDLSHVWVICDVYENDLKNVRVGETAELRLNAYPDRVFSARISNIGPILDPNIRTAKVRLEVENPGMVMRIGMFVTATFHGMEKETRVSVPSSAILHLHDRDSVYVPAGQNTFRRVEVTAGKMLPGNMQEIESGIAPGDRVIGNALVLQNTAEQ